MLTAPFTVGIPFGPFDAGDSVTAADVRARVPGADLDRLVRLGSLVPPPGVAVALVPAPVTEGEAELVADLQARLEEAEADRDLHKEQAAAVAAERDALAKRLQELEAAAEKAEKAAKGAAAKAAKAAPPEPVPPASGS